ncbi:IclR family transcriptional regulator [Mycolicibacterium sp. CBMA 334]|uniref:IclR family transcriptional regulator n=1 Tax=Mycolicibacterium sp. CBMA 334 TaxID=2606607 RepID=UPI0012DF3FDF|nr:helix-turn-helix domain-containing protein [Mycolicibacterium sp. CBMA 334]MUM02339.1 helix-turn-helix domain-containing protein [Mycolicibacterium sp. CBMA 334]
MAGDDASETITSSVRTLGRGLEILELFSGGDAELSQSDIAARAGLPMPTIHRLVKTLVAHEFLEPVAGGRNFRIGPAVLRLAGSLIARSDPAAIIRRKLQQLAETTGETTNLATLVGSSVVYLDGVAGGRILTPQVSVSSRFLSSGQSTALFSVARGAGPVPACDRKQCGRLARTQEATRHRPGRRHRGIG